MLGLRVVFLADGAAFDGQPTCKRFVEFWIAARCLADKTLVRGPDDRSILRIEIGAKDVMH